MHLINTLHISHDYAALCKLQLIPAYYPSAKRPYSISRAWQLQRTALPFSRDPFDIQPLLLQGPHHEGLIGFNQAGAIKTGHR